MTSQVNNAFVSGLWHVRPGCTAGSLSDEQQTVRLQEDFAKMKIVRCAYCNAKDVPVSCARKSQKMCARNLAVVSTGGQNSLRQQNEKRGIGKLRYITVRARFKSGEVLVCSHDLLSMRGRNGPSRSTSTFWVSHCQLAGSNFPKPQEIESLPHLD